MKVIYQPDLEIPHGNRTLWRYMGLDKFLDLVVHQRLYFTNVQNLTDGYEVTLPENILTKKKEALIEQGLEGQAITQDLRRYVDSFTPVKEQTLVNCWSLGPSESYALWKIYLGGSKAGMAIRTTVSALRRSIEAGQDPYPENVYIGSVQYTDILRESEINSFSLITTKRVFYDYEKELRLFILHDPDQIGGVSLPYNVSVGRHVKVDLNILVDRILISPFVGSWFSETIKSILARINPDLKERLYISKILDV